MEVKVNQANRPQLVLTDLTTFSPDEQERYREGLSTPTDPPTGLIHTIIVDVHEISRRDLQDDLDLDDEKLEAIERRRESELRRQEALEREQAQLQAMAVFTVDLPPTPAKANSIVDDD